jgi:periplasmic divalent cation tolerance protein
MHTLEVNVFLQVTTTLPDRAAADSMARSLVESGLAACVQVLGPVRSTYWWKDSLEQTDEWLCFIKTSSERYDALVRAIERIHPYEVPEIVRFEIGGGSERYLAWLDQVLNSRPNE